MTTQALQNLNNPEKIADLKKVIDNIVSSDAINEAKKIMVELENIFSRNSDFEKLDHSLFNTFNDFLVSLKFVLLFKLSDKEIIDLIASRFDFIFNNPDYDLYRKIRYKIASLSSLEERDIFKEKIRQALLNNKMLLGTQKITVSGIEHDPTVSAWIKDYSIKLGTDSVDALKMSEYIVKDQNTKTLTPGDKAKLKILFNFFEKIKISSIEYPAFEENFVAILPNQEIAVVSGGRLEKVSQETVKAARNISFATYQEKTSSLLSKPASAKASPTVTAQAIQPSSTLNELEQMLKKYSESSLEYKAISQEISRLKRSELKKTQKIDAKK